MLRREAMYRVWLLEKDREVESHYFTNLDEVEDFFDTLACEISSIRRELELVELGETGNISGGFNHRWLIAKID